MQDRAESRDGDSNTDARFAAGTSDSRQLEFTSRSARPADVEQLASPAAAVRLVSRRQARGTTPLVLMAHGFAAEKSFGLIPYAEQFVRRGLAVMLFDYRHFGGSGGEPRNLVSCRRQRQDWQAALDFARRLPGIDAAKIALWGSSFSGGHVVDSRAGIRMWRP